MKLRHKIWISLAVFAVATVLMIAGLFLTEETVTAIGLAGSGAIIYWVGIMLAISWWRCPVCGKRIDPPFKKKRCPRCGLEINYEIRGRRGVKGEDFDHHP